MILSHPDNQFQEKKAFQDHHNFKYLLNLLIKYNLENLNQTIKTFKHYVKKYQNISNEKKVYYQTKLNSLIYNYRDVDYIDDQPKTNLSKINQEIISIAPTNKNKLTFENQEGISISPQNNQQNQIRPNLITTHPINNPFRNQNSNNNDNNEIDLSFLEEDNSQWNREYKFSIVQDLVTQQKINNEQKELLEKCIDNDTDYYTILDLLIKLNENPTNFRIEFPSDLSKEAKTECYYYIIKHIRKTFTNIPILHRFMLDYKENSQWSSKSLYPEHFQELRDKMRPDRSFSDIYYIYIPLEESGGDSRNLPLFINLTGFGIRPVEPTPGIRITTAGSFFPYLIKKNSLPKCVVDYLNKLQIFESLTLDNENKQRPELNDCCFVYALKQLRDPNDDTKLLFSDQILNKIRLRLKIRHQSQKILKEIAKEFHLNIIIHRYDFKNNNYIKSKDLLCSCVNPIIEIHLNLIHNHYFIEEITPFTNSYITNLDQVPEDKINEYFDRRLKSGNWVRSESNRFIYSSNLVKTLYKLNYFIPITYGQFFILKTDFSDNYNKEFNYSLDYNPLYCTQKIEQNNNINNNNKKIKQIPEEKIYYADFETDTSGEYHKPYLCIVQNSKDPTITLTAFGEDCITKLLDWLHNGDLCYFHNLNYDGRLFAKFGIISSIIKGNKILKMIIKYKKKTIIFKDTLPILACKLSSLPAMFNLTNIQKELFPYNYYTFENFEKLNYIGNIFEAGLNENPPWNNSKYQIFIKNIEKIPGCYIEDDKFDMKKYAEFYCNQDVNILREGFNSFCKGFQNDFQINPVNFISISALANEVFNQRVYYPAQELYKVSGHLRHFLARAVYGGRCMCAYNKKWHITEPLYDFDAVSLYPSAMARLSIPLGIPKILEEKEQLDIKWLQENTNAYVVEIKITNVHKHYPFPLIVQKTENGNLNEDHNIDPNHPVIMVVDNITLEDLIEFQEIEYEIIQGYYWNEGVDIGIQNVIKDIFSKRKQYKREKNPLQNLYKLIMNSCYGKTIEKPINSDWKYIDRKDSNNYIINNYVKIMEQIQIFDSNIDAFKIKKPIDQHFNFSILGIQVLSMSKRIMNEVMCLAFDIGCQIYYQDTDSMHIRVQDLPKLEQAFKQKYGRDLQGEDLGQFHSDFATDNIKIKNKLDIDENEEEEEIEINPPYVLNSIESIFLMKKTYIDKLILSDGSIGYMSRAKGIPDYSRYNLAQKQYNDSIWDLYLDLFNGNQVTFDLLDGHPQFKMNKNMTIQNHLKFTRTLKTTYEEGNLETYHPQN